MAFEGARARNLYEWDGKWTKMLALKQTVAAEYTKHLQAYLHTREECISEIKRGQSNIFGDRKVIDLEKCTAEELASYDMTMKKQDATMLEHFTSYRRMTRTFEMETAHLCRAWAMEYLATIPAQDPVFSKAKAKDIFHSARKFWHKLLVISRSIIDNEDKNFCNELQVLDASKLWYQGPPGTRATSEPRLPSDLEAIHKLWDNKMVEGAWHESSDPLIRNAWVSEPGKHICGRCSKMTTHSSPKKQAGTCQGCGMVACERCQLEFAVLRTFETWTETEDMAWGPEPDMKS
jgi:hypothetical protein